MTTQQFLERLRRKTKRNGTVWVDAEGQLRAQGVSPRHCPLSYVAGTAPCEVMSSAKKLGLTQVAANNIAEAADGYTTSNKTLRERLEQAVGL